MLDKNDLQQIKQIVEEVVDNRLEKQGEIFNNRMDKGFEVINNRMDKGFEAANIRMDQKEEAANIRMDQKEEAANIRMDNKFEEFAIIVNSGFESQKKWTEDLIKSEMENQQQWTKEFVKSEFHNNNILMEQEFHNFKIWAEGTFVNRAEFKDFSGSMDKRMSSIEANMNFIRGDIRELTNRVEKLESELAIVKTISEDMQRDLFGIKKDLEIVKQKGDKVDELEKRVEAIEGRMLKLKAA